MVRVGEGLSNHKSPVKTIFKMKDSTHIKIKKQNKTNTQVSQAKFKGK